MRSAFIAALTFLALQSTAWADKADAKHQPGIFEVRVTREQSIQLCLSRNFSRCVESGEKEEECKGSQVCTIRLCRAEATNRCTSTSS